MMLKDEATAEFMEYCFRTLRKTGVAVCAISQGLEDFLVNGKARNAFVGAADNLFVLKQDNYDKARLMAQEKNLSDRELEHIQALVNTVPGSHAEFLLIQKTPARAADPPPGERFDAPEVRLHVQLARAYWYDRTLSPAAEGAATAATPLLEYPAGTYSGITFGPRVAADPSLAEPDR
jgi:hypothetical protein